ncbi:META domain-containing protein [Erythrobacter dokdonensis]|uniref:Heat shock protein n=1 Tax=Erythrobacter dokdonensis DSW-74 TaxID=1300349 RepID=A0A1A7BH98_9SPHN|nr:META domain-containing protein [Erythrobacter dokdonensis]OBV10590.1 heat shock protein [Erythrobacter dokdonensis DSW-74]
MINRKKAILRGKAVILAGGAALALAACATSSPPHPLEGTRWRLVDVETSGTSTRLTEELSSRHTLTFESERAVMQLDCNRGNARWSASTPRSGNGTISFGPVASTRALCPRPTFGEELASELPKASGYTLTSDGTGLIIRTQAEVYVFTRD